MIQYLDLLRHVLEHGKFKADRTGTGTYSVFGAQIRCPLRDSFPLLTTKKVHTKSIIYELLWFLRGDTNVKWLNEHGVTIWDEWADKDGNLGRVYGAQWTDWRTADGRTLNQIDDVIAQIKKNPDSRRHIVTRVESGRDRTDGAAAVPRAVPVLRERGRVELPALPAQRGYFPRRAVQHRQLRAAHADGRAGLRAEAGRFRPHVRRFASLREPRRAGETATRRASRVRCRR